jgi:flagellar motor switch protein FliN
MKTFEFAAPDAELLDYAELADPAGTVSLMPALNPLLAVRTNVQICVGQSTLSIGELTSLRQGQVLSLDRELDEAVDLLIEGRIVARGQLVAVGDCFGVRITETPKPLRS